MRAPVKVTSLVLACTFSLSNVWSVGAQELLLDGKSTPPTGGQADPRLVVAQNAGAGSAQSWSDQGSGASSPNGFAAKVAGLSPNGAEEDAARRSNQDVGSDARTGSNQGGRADSQNRSNEDAGSDARNGANRGGKAVGSKQDAEAKNGSSLDAGSSPRTQSNQDARAAAANGCNSETLSELEILPVMTVKSNAHAALQSGIEHNDVSTDVSTEANGKKAALLAPRREAEQKDEFAMPAVDPWTCMYNSALKAVQNRMYKEAEEKLLVAIKEAKHGEHGEVRLINARNLLAIVYCETEKLHEAEKLFDWTCNAAKRNLGINSEGFGTAAYGYALTSFAHGQTARADATCRQAIAALRRSVGAAAPEVGKSYILMAQILGKENFPDEAEPYLEKGLRILEKSPGPRQLDYADGLRMAAVYRQSRGQRKEASHLFERSYEITDKAVNFDEPEKLGGQVTYRWEEGSPRSLEIPDNDFPLRYFNVNGVRVAATVIDLWELFGVLISITNTGDERVVLGLDKVNLRPAKSRSKRQRKNSSAIH